MTVPAIATFVYGVLSLVGGWMGYQQAGSKVSLISGSITGILLLIASFALFQGLGWGPWLGIAVTALLVVTFVVRLVKTRKVMPAGLMVTAGVVTLAVLLAGVA
ncbi:MAG: hypothetical protein O2890_11970 [Cyanobacteria bacterium]|nr:hypothetical protein [Cyanobacteriota bacterium]MDA0867110.1 hypothetical protein [Cyanobacteriota bacterium]